MCIYNVCIYVYTYVYVYIYLYIYVKTGLILLAVNPNIGGLVIAGMYIYTRISVFIIYACIYEHVYVYICMCIYVSRLA
jgi:hypothetical protein